MQFPTTYIHILRIGPDRMTVCNMHIHANLIRSVGYHEYGNKKVLFAFLVSFLRERW